VDVDVDAAAAYRAYAQAAAEGGREAHAHHGHRGGKAKVDVDCDVEVEMPSVEVGGKVGFGGKGGFGFGGGIEVDVEMPSVEVDYDVDVDVDVDVDIRGSVDIGGDVAVEVEVEASADKESACSDKRTCDETPFEDGGLDHLVHLGEIRGHCDIGLDMDAEGLVEHIHIHGEHIRDEECVDVGEHIRDEECVDVGEHIQDEECVDVKVEERVEVEFAVEADPPTPSEAALRQRMVPKIMYAFDHADKTFVHSRTLGSHSGDPEAMLLRAEFKALVSEWAREEIQSADETDVAPFRMLMEVERSPEAKRDIQVWNASRRRRGLIPELLKCFDRLAGQGGVAPIAAVIDALAKFAQKHAVVGALKKQIQELVVDEAAWSNKFIQKLNRVQFELQVLTWAAESEGESACSPSSLVRSWGHLDQERAEVLLDLIRAFSHCSDDHEAAEWVDRRLLRNKVGVVAADHKVAVSLYKALATNDVQISRAEYMAALQSWAKNEF